MVVENALEHPVFSRNPCVRALELRFIAATALVTPSGVCLGTVVVMDRAARGLSAKAQESLRRLSRAVVRMLELRVALAETERARARAAAAQAATASAKDELVSLMSHEVRARDAAACGATRDARRVAPGWCKKLMAPASVGAGALTPGHASGAGPASPDLRTQHVLPPFSAPRRC